MSIDDPVQVAEDVWWVGKRLADDTFQCHAYLIVNGEDSVLLDPGSPLTIADTLAKVDALCGRESVRYLVCHHPDPDIAASLPMLSEALAREDVQVVTEWRAKALLKHYGHRFDYYLVEENGWAIPMGPERTLEFQLTPYLHFPGALVSYDTGTQVLFSSDLFGGFVPDSAILVSDDLDYIVENARPFHQHYMPSTPLLSAGLGRVRQRWPEISMIAPQHGHLIPRDLVGPVFDRLSNLECGVFSLADADIDLKHLLRIAEVKARITDALLTTAEPRTLVNAINSILAVMREREEVALFIELPDEGWTIWGSESVTSVRRDPDPVWPAVELAGSPAALLSLRSVNHESVDPDLIRMLQDMAPVMRVSVDEFLTRREETRRAARERAAAMVDPLTGLFNRRALESQTPSGDYALISVDVDRFKEVNDQFGHAAGDEVLQRVASAFTQFIRDGDFAYRLGGDEFLIVLPNVGEAPTLRIAQRIREAVRDMDFSGMAPDGQVTLSIGIEVARHRVREEFAEELEMADRALYASKHGGRDDVTVHGPRMTS